MNKPVTKIFVFLSLVLFISTSFSSIWGFFGHRRINRMAVFTLPPEMIPFYKKHIEFITEHAVDPDKRRYATKHEAVRHYIDIDHWGEYPFPEVPRRWDEVLMKYTSVNLILEAGDTVRLYANEICEQDADRMIVKSKQIKRKLKKDSFLIDRNRYSDFFRQNILPNYYEDEWPIELDTIATLFNVDLNDYKNTKAIAIDNFSGFGILPYHLVVMQRKLTEAFKSGKVSSILRTSAEFGHYIGDAHVPLHATTNYNGLLTNQVGIHAFWESRIPELFADAEFDFFVGKAEYIENPREYFWDVVLTSHRLVDSVLSIEKRLSLEFPEDQQYCYDDRLGRTIRTQCREYARAYAEAMDGMVEARMQASILSLGSAWYTAWIDAGQPNLKKLSVYEITRQEQLKEARLEEQYQKGNILGREHN